MRKDNLWTPPDVMRNRTTGEVVTQTENVTVAFDLQARIAVPLFDYFRKAAERVLASSI